VQAASHYDRVRLTTAALQKPMPSEVGQAYSGIQSANLLS